MDAINLSIVVVLTLFVAVPVSSTSPCPPLGYPDCARICQRSSLSAVTNPNSLFQLCGLDFRVVTEICEAAVCSRRERRTAGRLDATFCAPVYQRNATLSSAVTAAIAASTPIAIEATRGKAATKLKNYPQCAQDCIVGKGLLDFCGSLANRQCICNSWEAVEPVAICERTNCSSADVIRESALAIKLCGPIGGILANENGIGGVLS